MRFDIAFGGDHSRNVCIFGNGVLDRLLAGSGRSVPECPCIMPRMPVRSNETVGIESILGTTVIVRAVEEARLGPDDAVIPEVGGAAFITGKSECCFDPDDPLTAGFLLR